MQMNENESGAGSAVVDEDDENFTVNFDNVAEAKREVIPKNEYNVVIAEAEYKRSASANKPMWAIVLEIEDGEYTGRKIYTNLSFSEGALSLTKGSIKAFAPQLLTADFNPKKIGDSGDLLGLKARVKTKITMYEGEKQTSVARWMPPTGGANAFLNT